MNEPNAAAEAIPHAAVSRRKRRFSLVWVVPIVAALIGGWLVVKALSEKGPEITIYFKSAESLEAGKTKVKYKDVDIGLVTDISFDKDFSRVRVKVQMDKDAARLVSTNTRFWVVRARVSMAAVSGIGTVFSGAYITLDPGKPGDKIQVFTGLEEPPVVTSGMPGKHFVLEAETLGSLEVGAPIYFRQNRVGEVVARRARGGRVEGDRPRSSCTPLYDRYVLTGTRFWNASGIDFKVDATGLTVNTESVVSILFGGIAFDIVDLMRGARRAGRREHQLPALRQPRPRPRSGSTPNAATGCCTSTRTWAASSRGAPVLFKGIPVGQVLDVTLEYDSVQPRLPHPGRWSRSNPSASSRTPPSPRALTYRKQIDEFVQRGLRAQLVTANFLTGQQAVALGLLPERQAVQGRLGRSRTPSSRPSRGSSSRSATGSASSITRMEKIPIEQIAGNLRDTLEGTKRVANSPEILKTIKSLDAAIQELQAFTHELRTRTSPELVAAMQQARTSLASASSALESDSPLQSRMKAALEEITSAARSLRVLADYLERYPQSLLVGKDAPK
ncbi:MAG: MlaD family protein [Rhodopseudomonas palustris]|nr:MlaD family protein [Rhodopseudomonas palustris]